MKILVCDDRPERCEAIAADIKDACPGADVSMLSGGGNGSRDGKLEEGLKLLFERVGSFIPPSKGNPETNLSAFDGMDVVVLDNNLSYLNISGARLTAESIAGYIRVFTTAGYIVSINKNPDIDFDLRHLVGDRATRADIALNTEHLSNGALWGKGGPADGFAPWYWPDLADAVERRCKQIAFVAERFTKPALAALDLDGDAEDRLSRRAIGRFRAEGNKDPTTITFRDLFLSSTRSIPDRDDRVKLVEKVESGTGGLEMLARVVAADLDLWFRSDVLGAQDILVDAPHLAARMPFLLGDGASDQSGFDRVASDNDDTCGFMPKLFEKHVATTRYSLDMWSQRPVFRWDKLREDDGLAALYASGSTWADVVFCEDLSRFVFRDASERPREFVTDIESSYDRRYVAKLGNKKYVPASQFALS